MRIEDLKPGDVLLCLPDPNSWIGRAIVRITKGEVSHAAVYVGERNGETYIAHSEAEGIVYMPLNDFIKHEPAGFYARRHHCESEGINLQPVLNVAEKYVKEGLPYPYANLVLLGVLILLNRFSEDTTKNRVFYNFALLVAIKLMKEVRKVVRQGKETMVCSHFVAQCYTDAGVLYDIKFHKLLLQFGETPNLEKEISLFDMLESGDEDELALNESEFDAILEQEEQIAQDFIELMENKENLPLAGDMITAKKVSKVSAKIVESLCHLLTGEKPKSRDSAIQTIRQFSTNRNFLVTPDDLLSNTKNLKDLGLFGTILPNLK